jgi:hypothetical protein
MYLVIFHIKGSTKCTLFSQYGYLCLRKVCGHVTISDHRLQRKLWLLFYLLYIVQEEIYKFEFHQYSFFHLIHNSVLFMAVSIDFDSRWSETVTCPQTLRKHVSCAAQVPILWFYNSRHFFTLLYFSILKHNQAYPRLFCLKN